MKNSRSRAHENSPKLSKNPAAMVNLMLTFFFPPMNYLNKKLLYTCKSYYSSKINEIWVKLIMLRQCNVDTILNLWHFN